MTTKSAVQIAFSLVPVELSISSILPSKQFEARKLSSSSKFDKIESSIKVVGIIEPLIVFPAGDGKYILLDGHLRLEACKSLGIDKVTCLESTDDESFTYNRRVNRLATIQEHLMIKRAIERGVSEERIAQALSMHIGQIKKKAQLLDGICKEAVHLMKDMSFSAEISSYLRMMKPARQVEVVELMIAANSLTVPYCKALFHATDPQFLVNQKKPKLRGLSPETIARMEQEMANLNERYKFAEQSYGEDVLNFILVKGYVAKLLENDAVARWIVKRHSDLIEQLQAMARNELVDYDPT